MSKPVFGKQVKNDLGGASSDDAQNTGHSPVTSVLPSALQGLPIPRPNARAYYGNMLFGFIRYPQRALNYLRFRRSKRTAHLNYLPVKLDVEPLSRCNFHCTMCQVSDWPKNQRSRDLTVEEFKGFIKEQYGLYEIKLQGLGEPLLLRDDFFEMIRYARSRHIWVRTTTNGSLLHLKDNYKKLIDSGVSEVQISFDGATKETFEKIRRGSVFEKVRDNCKLINAYCANKRILKTRMWVVVQQHNLPEFFDFVHRASEMGFKRLTFSLDLIGWAQDSWISANKEVSAKHWVTREMAEQAISLGDTLGVQVTFWNATDKFRTDKPEHLCPWPFERAYISSDMRVVPCCMVGNPDTAELGPAKSFTEVWHGAEYAEFRRQHLEGRLPKICKTCYAKKSTLNVLPSEDNETN